MGAPKAVLSLRRDRQGDLCRCRDGVRPTRPLTSRPRPLAYLILYNVMFILPLVVIFILAYFGLQSSALVRFAQRHTGTTKLLLTVVFIGLGVLLLATT